MATNYTATGKAIETPNTIRTPIKEYERIKKKSRGRRPTYSELKESPLTEEVTAKSESEAKIKAEVQSLESKGYNPNTLAYDEKGKGFSISQEAIAKQNKEAQYKNVYLNKFNQRVSQRPPSYAETLTFGESRPKQTEIRKAYEGVKTKSKELVTKIQTVEGFKPSQRKGKVLLDVNLSKPYRETEQAVSYLFKSQVISPVENSNKNIFFRPSDKKGKEILNINTGFVGRLPVAIYEEAKERPIKFTAQTYAFGKFIEIGEGVITTGKTLRTINKGKFVPIERVVAKDVLTKKSIMPLSKNIPQSLKEFSKSNIVVTATPSKIKGNIVSEIKGSKGSKGLEDLGIYVTPKGQASPYFLRVSREEYAGYTLNPLTIVRRTFQQPRFVEFRTKGVTLQPRRVVSVKGFKETRKFFEETGSKTGKAYITKRSEIGLGNIKRKGELGTSELEAVIPFKAEYKYVPSNKYTFYEGRAIPIEKAIILSKSEVKNFKVTSPTINSIKNRAYSVSSRVSEGSGKYLYLPSSRVSSNKSSSRINNNYSYSLSSKVSSISPIKYSRVSSNKSSSKVNSYISSPKSYKSSSKVNSYISSPKSFYSISKPEYSKVSSISTPKYPKRPILRYPSISRPKTSLRPLPYYPIKRESRNFKKFDISKIKNKSYSKVRKQERLNILPSLRNVFIYEAETGREAILPKKTKKVKRLFEEQYFGENVFGSPIPVYQKQKF